LTSFLSYMGRYILISDIRSHALLHVQSTIFDHVTTSRLHFSNCTGFQWIQSMSEFTSRSVSSWTIYTPTLLHTIYPPGSTLLLHLVRAESATCLQRRLHLRSILPDVWKSSLLNQWSAGRELPSKINVPLYNCWQFKSRLKTHYFHLTMTTRKTDFLHNWNQRVALPNGVSSFQHVSRGVSQGSVLGPLLFLSYINDITDLFPSAVNIKLALRWWY